MQACKPLCRIIGTQHKDIMTLKKKFILIGLTCILTGSVWFYFQGHKDIGLVNYLSYILTFIGWLIILFSVAGQFLLKNKTKYKTNKSKWFSQSFVKTGVYIAFAGLVLGNIIFINNLEDNRVSSILNNEPTKITIANVTEIENRNSRGGPKSYAIIKYTTDNGTIEQLFFNYNNQYSVGQTYELKYSVDYPEMCTIVRQVENK